MKKIRITRGKIPSFWNKCIRIMKLTLLFLTIGLFQVSGSVYSQTTKLTLKIRDSKVAEILDAIENQSEFRFAYSPGYIDLERRLSVDVKEKTLEQCLQIIFNETDVKYEILDRHILLFPDAMDRGSGTVVAYSHSKISQQRTVSGKVTDAEGQPLPGVSIVIKGTTQGTVTNADGNYSLTNIPDDATLVFSFIGMLTKEVVVGSQTSINVTMQEETVAIEEVVAIGYGTQKKRDVSTSISSVSREALDDRSAQSFTRAIAGEMPGVRIFNNNNAPGGGTNIRIRGVSSINASNNPLLVIDGFPLKDGFSKYENPLNSINPNDIESIEVLKDASSSAIYGAQAANGVILITTRKGREGKPTINIDVSVGMESMLTKIDMLNREDFLQFMDDARAQAYIVEDPNFGSDDPNAPLWSWSDSDETRINNWKTYSTMAKTMSQGTTLYERWCHVTAETKAQPYDTDWQDAVTDVGQVLNIQLSTTGGTDIVKYMVSGGHYKQDGILSGTGYGRYSFRSNAEFNINNWMRMGLLLAPSLENLDVVGIESLFQDVLWAVPLYPDYDEEGNIAYLGAMQDILPPLGFWAQWNIRALVNPLNHDKIKDNIRTIRNIGTIFGEIDIFKDLKIRSEFHNEFKNRERNYYLPGSYPTTNISTTTRSRGINEISSRFYWSSQNYFTYDKNFNKHTINAMLGYSAQESSYRSNFMEKYDFPSDHLETLNQGMTILDAQNDSRTNRYSESEIGSFARAMYNYGGKYYLTASVRRDGSSKFGSKRKWGTFPSFSAAWRISDETFFSPLIKYVNDLKIRGGWGIIGNSGIGNYNALSTLVGSSYVLGAASSTINADYQDGKIANKELGWEQTTDYDIGVDAELLNSRISLSVDYFYKLTEDMLFSLPLPRITGFSSTLINIGSMRNRGFEYLVKTRNFVKDFKWSTTANLSYYRNRVLDTGKDKRPLISTSSYTEEGKPLAGLYGYAYMGVYKDWEDVKTNPIVNAGNPRWMYRSCPGTAKHYDVNADGIIDGSDQTIIGSPNPDFVWGMTNNFSYKGFDLSVQVTGVTGGNVLMTQLESFLTGANKGQDNISYHLYNNYWRPERTEDALYPAPSRKSWDKTSSRGTALFKQNYVNFQNVVLGYSLSRNLLRSLDISKVRFYLSIQNALLFTDYPGYNPEVNAAGDSSLSQAVDAGAYPLTRIFSFGINLSL